MPQLYNLFDPLIEGVQVHDFDWRYIYVNDALVKNSTYTREELLGFTVMEKYPGVEQTELFKAMQRCMVERTVEETETEFVFPNGTIAYFEISMQPVPEGIFILSVNRTERHITKENLVKVNRLYAFISAINQSIVQINDQQILLNKACDIAINIGQFEKAWIFLLDDLTGKLEIVSQCGKPSGWEKELKSVHIDNPLLNGTPTGKVITTGEYAFCNDIQNDPAMQHWKKELGENGIKASISLPLKKDGKVIGIFGLHSSIANFFDEEEIVLLQEAAGDVSFALQNFDKATKHKEAEQNLLENEEKYRPLFENNPMPMMVIDAATFQFLDVNQMAILKYGYSREEFLSMTALDIRPEEDKAYFKQLDRSFETLSKNTNRGIGNHIKKDGTIIKVEIIANQITFEGIPARFILANDVTKRIEAENRERENESRFRVLIEQANDAVCIIDASGRIIEVNPASCLLFGYSREEFLQLSMPALLFEEDLKKHPLRIDDLKAGKAVRNERIFKAKDGIQIETEVNSKMLENGNIIMFAHDISERKHAQHKLIESESHLAEAQLLAKTGSWNFDVKTERLTWSEELYNIFSTDRQKFTGTRASLLEFIDEKDKASVLQAMKQAQKTGAPFTAEYNITTSKGEKRVILGHGHSEKDDQGNIIRMFGTTQDITKSKLAETKLIRSEARLKEAQAIAHSSSWEIDLINNIHTWSDELYNIYGINKDEVQASTELFLSFMHPDDVDEAIENVRQCHKTLIPSTLNFRFIRKDGALRYGYTERRFEFDENDKPIRFYGIIQDVTQRKLAELKLEEQNQELVKTNAELDRFVYSVSHDLRSPLTSILGLVSFIEEESQEEHTVELATMIRTSVNRLDNFIKNILSYSQNNRTELEVEQIPVSKTIDDIVESLRSIQEAKGIHFDITIDEQQPFYSDWQRVSTIVENLISNAIKYHKIDQTDRYIKITGTSDNEKLNLTIADNGIGIAPAHHAKIFNMFYRLSGQAQGSGIGLYIVKETLDKLQGSIAVKSEQGVGTSFDISVKNLTARG